ncbi:hypothetical protein Ddye_023853 [Dipteronia dyeriana]|uniref:Reverse transcriptase domain-containing protein n=1 Tax=Dipteronia dyeriana TaxID=168575 RepID=A0AAD9WTT6_9ROSI|nr:hypothetical protein Ddye_023853 [Dipteronia dyeriana]
MEETPVEKTMWGEGKGRSYKEGVGGGTLEMKEEGAFGNGGFSMEESGWEDQIIITWIKACLTTSKFSISINGELAGFFSGKRGLRQGDPMFPYLFVIAMEVLSKILSKRIADSPSFKYHWKCDKIKLSHLCFADDLIMIFHGSFSSAFVLKAALDEFFLLIKPRAISLLRVYPLQPTSSSLTSLVTRSILYPFAI